MSSPLMINVAVMMIHICRGQVRWANQGWVVERMPAEAAHEVVLNDGERGEYGCKRMGPSRMNVSLR
jgi:hypothetical protein